MSNWAWVTTARSTGRHGSMWKPPASQWRPDPVVRTRSVTRGGSPGGDGLRGRGAAQDVPGEGASREPRALDLRPPIKPVLNP